MVWASWLVTLQWVTNMDYRDIRTDIIEGVIAGALPGRLIMDHEIEELSQRVDAAVFDCMLGEAYGKNPSFTFAEMDTLQ